MLFNIVSEKRMQRKSVLKDRRVNLYFTTKFIDIARADATDRTHEISYRGIDHSFLSIDEQIGQKRNMKHREWVVKNVLACSMFGIWICYMDVDYIRSNWYKWEWKAAGIIAIRQTKNGQNEMWKFYRLLGTKNLVPCRIVHHSC